MEETLPMPAYSDPVAVLFHPSTVPIIDIFRSIDRFEDQYDLTLLDEPERALSRYTSAEIAKGIVSDTLLMAFSLNRQREKPFEHRPVNSRPGSVDEYCLMTLIRSAHSPVAEVSREAAAALEVTSLDFMASLTGEIGRQMDRGSLVFIEPTLPEFRAVIGTKPDRAPWSSTTSDGFNLTFRP